MNGLPDHTDAELLELIAASNMGALREFYSRHAPWLSLRLERRCNDPDLVASALQDCFLSVWRHPGSWRWPGAIVVVTVAVVLWGMTSLFAGVSTRESLLWHLSAPTTVPDTDFTDGPYAGRWFYRGSAPWRFIYVAGLCALAGIASVAHGAVGGRRRRLQLLAVAAAMLTVTALVLSAYTGPMNVKIR